MGSYIIITKFDKMYGEISKTETISADFPNEGISFEYPEVRRYFSVHFNSFSYIELSFDMFMNLIENDPSNKNLQSISSRIGITLRISKIEDIVELDKISEYLFLHLDLKFSIFSLYLILNNISN